MGQSEKAHFKIRGYGYRLIACLNDADIERRQGREFGLTLLYEERAEFASINRRIAQSGNEVGDASDMV